MVLEGIEGVGMQCVGGGWGVEGERWGEAEQGRKRMTIDGSELRVFGDILGDLLLMEGMTLL